MKTIKTAIIGATGYAGAELMRLLYSHPNVSVEIVTSKTYAGEEYTNVYENFNHISNLKLKEESLKFLKMLTLFLLRFLTELQAKRLQKRF